MNTCTRRFLLRLMIGLLTFAIGVGTAMLIGGFNPFNSNSRWMQGYRSGGYHRHSCFYADEVPGEVPAIILLKGPRGFRIRSELRELLTPPVAELPVAPAQPNP